MSLDATVKGPTANSYLTRAEATVLLVDSRLHSTAWSSATDADKDKALIWATSLIDTSFDFDGNKTTQEQALRWPRAGLLNRDNWYINQDTLPNDLKLATAELAMALLGGDRTLEPSLLGKGISSAKVGPIEVKLDKSQVASLMPSHVIQLLENIGAEPIGGGSGSGGLTELRLERT